MLNTPVCDPFGPIVPQFGKRPRYFVRLWFLIARSHGQKLHPLQDIGQPANRIRSIFVINLSPMSGFAATFEIL